MDFKDSVFHKSQREKGKLKVATERIKPPEPECTNGCGPATTVYDNEPLCDDCATWRQKHAAAQARRLPDWRTRLRAKLAEGKVYPGTCSLTNGRGGFIHELKIRAMLDRLVEIGKVAKDQDGGYRFCGEAL